MNKVNSCLILILFSTQMIFSQSPDTLWTRIFEFGNQTEGVSIAQTSDSGFIITGEIYSASSQNFSLLLLKTNSLGEQTWMKDYKFNRTAYGTRVIITDDGGYLVVGDIYYAPSGPFGDYNALIIKTDSNGDSIWTKSYGGSGDDYLASVERSPDGNYICVGSTDSYSSSPEVWLFKIDTLGNLIWSKTYGGEGVDRGFSVQPCDSGNYIISGKTFSFDKGLGDVWLIKVDDLGNMIWSKSYGGPMGDSGNSVQQTRDNGFIICGYTSSFGSGSNDIWLLKTDEMGDTTWTKTFGGNNSENAWACQISFDQGYILTGNTNSFGAGNFDVYLIRTNMFGETIWTKTIGGYNWEFGEDVIQLPDGGYIVVGYSTSFGNSSQSLYLIRVDKEKMVANFESDATFGRLPLSANFTDLSTKIATNWQWDFDNDGIIDSYEQNPAYTYFDEDTFSVRLIASNGFMTDSLLKENYITTYFDSFPNLYSIEDIPNDQGGWVNVHFARSMFDTDSLIHPRIKSGLYTVEANYDSLWTAVNSTAAYGKSYYSVLVPTAKDSTAYSNGLIDFRIIAGMDEGNFASNVLSGYSVDNLKPNAPRNLQGVLVQDTIASLQWSANKDDDLQYYSAYRSTDGIIFELINETIDTTLIDTIDFSADSVMYAVKAVDYAGNHSDYSNFVNFNITNINQDVIYDLDFRLHQNYPNPFNPKTTFQFSLKQSRFVTMKIYDILGEEVATLVSERLTAGQYKYEWDAGSFASGVYLYRIQAGDYVDVKKMVLMK
jgi:PKD repeat protein